MQKLVSLLFVILATSACGQKGPLVYPEMLVPTAPSSITAQQSGNSIKLSFVIPTKDLAGRKFSDVSGITILKRDEPFSEIPTCSACTEDFALFRKLNLDLLPSGTSRYGNLLVLLDSDVQNGRVYTYRLFANTGDNKEGAQSTPIRVRMLVSPQPPVLRAISKPTEIQLEFTGLPPDEGAIAGYAVYRALKGEAFPLLPLSSELLTGNSFIDVGLERGIVYVYGVRSVVRVPSGDRVESGLSNQVEGTLLDDE